MSFMSRAPTPPEAFDKAMVFIDGSNLLPRLREAKLKVPSFFNIARTICGRRRLSRVYFYTSREKIEKAEEEKMANPAVIVIGEVVSLHPEFVSNMSSVYEYR